MHHEVVIVGGGVAGLGAARSLQHHGVTDVCIVEARDALGGRVQQVHGVAPWPLEAGPEFVHGANNPLVRILQEDAHMKLHEKVWPNKFYWGKRLVGTDGDGGDALNKLNHLMFEVVRTCLLIAMTTSLSVLMTTMSQLTALYLPQCMPLSCKLSHLQNKQQGANADMLFCFCCWSAESMHSVTRAIIP